MYLYSVNDSQYSEVMNDYRITVNGTVLNDEPEGMMEFEIRIQRADRVLEVMFPNTMIFRGDGYEELYNLKVSDGYCGETDIVVELLDHEGVFQEMFTGLIKVADCSFDRVHCSVEAQITDKGYRGRVSSNGGITIDTGSTTTLGGEVIAAVTMTDKTYNRDPAPVGSNTFTAKSVPLKDVLEYVTNYLTDNAVTFTSQLLDDWDSPNDSPYLTTGANLEDSSNSDKPQVKVDGVYRDSMKLFGGYLIAEKDTLKLVDFDDWAPAATTSNTVIIRGAHIRESFASEAIYSTIEVGTNNSHLGPYELVKAKTFNEEQIDVPDPCAVDISKDLSTQFFIIDNSTIRLLADKGVTQDIERLYGRNRGDQQAAVVLIQDEHVTELPVTGYDYPKGGTSNDVGTAELINHDLTNINVINRNKFTCVLTDVDNGEDDKALVEKSSDNNYNNDTPGGKGEQHIQDQGNNWFMAFDDDSSGSNHNVNGNFDTSDYSYTAPRNGLYTFGLIGRQNSTTLENTVVAYINITTISGSALYSIRACVVDENDEVVDSYKFGVFTVDTTNVATDELDISTGQFNANIRLKKGQKVKFALFRDSGTTSTTGYVGLRIYSDLKIDVEVCPAFGGTTTVTRDDSGVSKYDMEQDFRISRKSVFEIIDNPQNALFINHTKDESNDVKVWIDEVYINPFKGLIKGTFTDFA